MGFKPKKTQKNKQQFWYVTYSKFKKKCKVQTHPNIRYLWVLLMDSHVISSRNRNMAINVRTLLLVFQYTTTAFALVACPCAEPLL